MDSNDTTTKASSVNLEWQNFSSGSMNTTGAIAPSLPSSVDSSSSSSSSAASSGGPSQPPPVVLPQGFLAWLSPTYYRALFDIDTNDVLLRLRYALFPFQSSSTSSTTVSSSSSSVANLNPSSNSFLSLVQQRPDWYGSVWCTLTLVAVIASGSQLAAWLNFRPELKTSSSSSSSTNNLTLLTPPVWQFDVTALSSSLMVSYAFAFWAPLIIRAGMAYLRITSNIITFPVLVCVWGYGIAPYILGAVSIDKEYISPELVQIFSIVYSDFSSSLSYLYSIPDNFIVIMYFPFVPYSVG